MIEQDIELTQEEFVQIRDFIHERSGIYFADNKLYLIRNRLTKRMSELQMRSFRDYLLHVKYDTSLKEFNELMNVVTTNETSFFRNEPQLQSFADELLPGLIQQKLTQRASRTIRIWSAGCSTGEEPYTLAILLLEKLRGQTGWQLEIIANDISEQVLAVARQGEYTGITLRNLRPDMLSKYFTVTGDRYRVNADVRALVRFTHMNLNDPRKLSVMNNLDVIFCRNVMIYFSEDVKKQLVRGFYNALAPNGYFFIGHSETLHGISKAFKLVYFKQSLVYQKEATAADTPLAPSLAAGTGIVRSSAPAAPITGASRAQALLGSIKREPEKKLQRA